MNQYNSDQAKPHTLAKELGYAPKSFQEFNAKKRNALLQVEEREQKRISNALQEKMAWQA